MNKKIFAVFAALTATCCGLAGCSKPPKGPDEEGYAALNEMLKVQYREIVLTVENDFGGDKLTSVYTISYGGEAVTVSYTVENFAHFSETSQQIEKKVGKITVEGGEVVSTEGDDIGLTAAIATLPFEFRAEYFENAELTGGYLSADVKDVSAFMGGTAADLQDMHFEATFFDSFYTMEIACTAASAKVRAAYTFTL